MDVVAVASGLSVTFAARVYPDVLMYVQVLRFTWSPRCGCTYLCACWLFCD